eukprot:SAG31_NODE_2689_length_5243_cov_3.364697_4_plen_164_part_00
MATARCPPRTISMLTAAWLLGALPMGVQAGGWEISGADTCELHLLQARLDVVAEACCGSDGAGCADGTPLVCDLACATEYIQLFSDCASTLTAHFDATDGAEDRAAKVQQGFYELCVSQNRVQIASVITQMNDQGCAVDTNGVVAPVRLGAARFGRLSRKIHP